MMKFTNSFSDEFITEIQKEFNEAIKKITKKVQN